MCRQYVPGSLSPSPESEPGFEANCNPTAHALRVNESEINV